MNVKRAVAGGLIGTAAMTMLMLVGPLMGFPPLVGAVYGVAAPRIIGRAA